MMTTPCPLPRIPAAGAAAVRALLLALALLPRAAIAAPPVALTGAIVHPVTGPALTNAPVVVRDGRIEAVGAGTEIPPDATRVDLAGLHLFPGLVATATVLGLQEIDAVRATRDTSEVGDYTPEVAAWTAINPDSELIAVARANGITHAESIPLGGIVSGFSGVTVLDGWTVEDMAYHPLAALHVQWPSFRLDTTPKDQAPDGSKWRSLEDQARDRDRRLAEIDAFFSDAEAYVRARDTAPASHPRIPAWEAMRPVLAGKAPVALHADEFRQIRSAVDWVVRRGYRAVLVGGRDAGRLAGDLARHRIPVVYEHVFTLPPREIDPSDVQFGTPARLAAAGVRVAFSEGSDRFSATNLRNLPYAAAQAMAFGLPREEALRGLTLNPAACLGVDDRLGSIEPGKEATLIAVDGDILDIRSVVRRMWIAGREVSLENRHTRLYERYRSRPGR